MIKQLILPLIAVAAFIILVGYFSQKSSFSFLGKDLMINKNTPTQDVVIDNKTIHVEIAKTESDREKGLGGRAGLAVDGGMLFVFDSKGVSPTFWMKDMEIPLDIIWIKDGKIVKIDKNVAAPPPGTADKALTVYSPGQPIDYVLEVNGGYADGNGIKVGDSVTLPTL